MSEYMNNIQHRIIPSKWVKAHVFEAATGYSKDALDAKRKTGVWEEGAIWKKAPDGNILYSIPAYEKWVEGNDQAA